MLFDALKLIWHRQRHLACKNIHFSKRPSPQNYSNGLFLQSKKHITASTFTVITVVNRPQKFLVVIEIMKKNTVGGSLLYGTPCKQTHGTQ